MVSKTGAGGTFTHKNPDCRCNACSARRRKAEAIALTAGAGRSSVVPVPTPPTTLAQISADFPLVAEKGNSPKERVMQWMALRSVESGITNTEIARRMGISRLTLQRSLTKATQEGWLKFTDPLARVEHEIIPKTLDNMTKFLNEGDRTVTIEAFKSTIARQYLESKGVSDAPQTVLALKIEAADPEQVKFIGGTVVGKPKELRD